MLNQENLRRVFFHELGHFIANELNSKLGCSPNTRSIIITTHTVHTDDFEGETTLDVPPDYPIKKASDVPISKLASYIATVMYGCVVQAYITNTDLDCCIKQNGSVDIAKRNMAIYAHDFILEKPEFSKLLRYFYEMFEIDITLTYVSNLSFGPYIMQIQEGKFTVDIDKLRSESRTFLEEHINIYKILIANYEDFIQKTLEKIRNEKLQGR